MLHNTQNFNIDAERAVLGTLILEPDKLTEIDIKPEDFFLAKHKDLFKAILSLYHEKGGLDLVTLSETHPELLHESTEACLGVVSTANIKFHADIVKSRAKKRFFSEELTKLLNQTEEDGFLGLTEKTLLSFQDYDNSKLKVSLPALCIQIADQTLDFQGKDYGIQTGFSSLNNAIVGLCPRQLILLGAYTSYGKSSLLAQIISDICQKGAKVVVFSVEDSRQDKLTKIISTEANIPVRMMLRGQCDYKEVLKASEKVMKYDLEIYDDCYELEQIELKIKKHVLKGGVDVVCIDFVQNIIVKAESIYDRMSTVAIALQRMAKKYNCCVLALSQVSSEEKGKIALRGAQELASAADIILWIDRNAEKQERNFNLLIRKNRQFGVTGRVEMTFSENWTNIKEVYHE